MTRIIMIRHGQSIANEKHLFAGHSDFDLTDLGRKQASLAAEYLKKNEPSISAIYASDLKRAFNTALPIGEALGITVIPDTQLREIFAGQWEALSFEYIAENYVEAFGVWKNDYSNACPVDGESTADVYRRIIPYVLSVAEKHPDSTVVLATHATVVRAVEAWAQGYSAEESGKVSFCQNAALNIYRIENGKAEVERSCILDHLGDLVTVLPSIINA